MGGPFYTLHNILEDSVQALMLSQESTVEISLH
jgi:hypothetical protein